VRVHRLTRVRFTLSKISNVSFAVTYNGLASAIDSSLVPHGAHYFVWRPAHAGAYTITLSAVDAAGNKSSVTAAVTVGG
jgi:hypothetical protein